VIYPKALPRPEDLLADGHHPDTPAKPQSFLQYAAPFFVWDRCPHIRRVLEETGRFTQRHARIQRGRLENHVFGDSFAAKRLSEITRADIFDLRSRLLKRCSPATTNKVIDAVKVVLREAVIREELRRDPTDLVRRVRHQKRERGVFTVEELRRLFPDRGYGPWKDACDCTCFDPDERDPDIRKLPDLNAAMDRAVLDAYGWADIDTSCEFLLDYEIDEEEWGDKKKPWRYRWPDDVQAEVLARLLELNAERARAESRAGAHRPTSPRGRKATRRRGADLGARELFP